MNNRLKVMPKEDVKSALRAFYSKSWVRLLVGVLIGALLVLGVRFVLIKDTRVHYHANFGLYINGERDKFDSFTFYEEVASCSAEDLNNPKTRVHLHQPNNDVVHVHDHGVTWGMLLANLGYVLGSDVIKTGTGLYVDGQEGKTLQFILNGEAVPAVANRPIENTDALLITYGTEDEAAVKAQYDSIKKDAKHYNETPDPSSCSGSEPFNTGKRLKETLKLGS